VGFSRTCVPAGLRQTSTLTFEMDVQTKDLCELCRAVFAHARAHKSDALVERSTGHTWCVDYGGTPLDAFMAAVVVGVTLEGGDIGNAEAAASRVGLERIKLFIPEGMAVAENARDYLRSTGADVAGSL
jgi:hypothetical protein